jgi:beta-lactamase superfamily II metal-dependent hydrolase
MYTLQESARSLRRLHAGDQISFSPACSAEVLYPPAALQAEGGDGLVLKMHLGRESLLLMPSVSHDLEGWLLKNIPSTQLHASVLVLPWSPMSVAPEDPFLKAVAPHDVVIGRDLRHQAPPNPAWKELFQAQGMTLFYQQESGALIVEALPEKTAVSSLRKN